MGAEAFSAEEIASLPARIYTSEVCRLARYGPGKLWRERRAGRMPAPIDRGREDIFDRDAVFKALGMMKDGAATDPADEWSVDPDAIRHARPRKVRHPASAQGRDAPRVLSGSGAASPARLVVANTPAARRGA